MSGLDVKAFDQPDELVRFELGHVELVRVGSLTLGREVLQPGWRWSTHVRPLVGTEWCEFHHVGYLQSGRIAIMPRDGEAIEIAAGAVTDVAPGHDAWVVGDEPAVTIDFQGVEGWGKPPEPGERVLRTILFTDIVDSTKVAERLGDRAWRVLLRAHREDVRGLLTLTGGHEVDTTGDGFLATFDAPSRALMCALGIVGAARKLGFDIRAGVHTGEVEVSNGDLQGVAVHLAARIMAAAGPGEVFVSATSRELSIGAPVQFIDRGSRLFKGFTDERAVYEVRSAPAS